jgi:hypothetical protein
MAIKIPNGRMYVRYSQMVIKYIDIFHFKTLQIYPNRDFWFENIPSGNPVRVFRGEETDSVTGGSQSVSKKPNVRPNKLKLFLLLVLFCSILAK